MSRIGKAPILLDEKVKVEVHQEKKVLIHGKKEMKAYDLPSFLSAKIDKNQLILNRKNDSKNSKAFHGLYRSLIQNRIQGVLKGWEKKLIFNGIGYRATLSGKKLTLNLGYSHPIEISIPEGLDIQVIKNTTLLIRGEDKEKVGKLAARIRSLRPPEPFLGKGIKEENEKIFRKAGKAAAKGGGK